MNSAFSLETVVMTTLVSTIVVSAQSTIRIVLDGVVNVICHVFTMVFRTWFRAVVVHVTSDVNRALQGSTSAVHARQFMVSGREYTAHFRKPGWYLLMHDDDKEWVAADTWRAVVLQLVAITKNRYADPEKNVAFWGVMYVTKETLEHMHALDIAEKSTALKSKAESNRSTYSSSRTQCLPVEVPQKTTCVTVYVPKPCLAAFALFLDELSSYTIEVPDTTYGYVALHEYVLESVARDTTQVLGYMMNAHEAVGVSRCLLENREYRVEAPDKARTPLVVLKTYSGHDRNNYRGSHSLFVRLAKVQGRKAPVQDIHKILESMQALAERRAKVHLLFFERMNPRDADVDCSHGHWRASSSTDQRALCTVYMEPARLQALTEDIDTFLCGEARYRSLGVPWKRTYLLWGEPGTGKTSLIRALASKYKWTICEVRLKDTDTDVDLAAMALSVPRNSMLVFEDVDRICFRGSTAEKSAAADSRFAVTLQGLLNALDGLQECSGRVCILTANHRSLLDPALYRQGRVDVQVEMPRMQSAALVEAMMVRFFKGASDTDVAAAAAKVLLCSRDGAVAPCVVQDLCMRCVDKGLQALLDMPDEQLLESFV